MSSLRKDRKKLFSQYVVPHRKHGTFVELFQAEGADKVLRVELLGHGCDTAACDRLLTAGAEGATALV
ncbi:hypothetical protein INR49_025584, partial [Caranx melampygus]